METVRTILLCASHYQYEEIIEWHSRLTMDGYVVLSPALHREEWTEEKMNESDVIQIFKISLCDDIFVLDPGGKIDKRLVYQIKKAQELGKRVLFLSKEYPNWKGEYLYATKPKLQPSIKNIKEISGELNSMISEFSDKLKEING
jgi:hypothetical protein